MVQHFHNGSCLRGAYGDFWIETSFHHCGKRALLNFPCFVVVAHQDFRRLTTVFSDQLIIVLGEPHLVHLSGLTKPLKFNLFFFRDSQRSLKFFECFAKGFLIDRSAICLTQEQTVIAVQVIKICLILFDLIHALVDFERKRSYQV